MVDMKPGLAKMCDGTITSIGNAPALYHMPSGDLIFEGGEKLGPPMPQKEYWLSGGD